jgi:hypothetical protein
LPVAVAVIAMAPQRTVDTSIKAALSRAGKTTRPQLTARDFDPVVRLSILADAK